MENLRWILIFAGVAILVLLYFSGRQPKSARRQSEALDRSEQRDAHTSNDPLLSDDGFGDSIDEFGIDEALSDPLARPAGGGRAVNQEVSRARGSERDDTPKAATGGFGGISSKIEAFGSMLSPKRRARAAQEAPSRGNKPGNDGYASKIVTLHVVAPEGQLMNGGLLLEQFEQRNYHYGDMNIFHSIHEGKTVFSIAKLVVPGTFDVNDVDSFQTPGISLILQLPGPVPADVAFEVLLSEAHEIADTLGATVLDADRSTLSNQTVQHMREGINEYMHRQKYFSGVPS